MWSTLLVNLPVQPHDVTEVLPAGTSESLCVIRIASAGSTGPVSIGMCSSGHAHGNMSLSAMG